MDRIDSKQSLSFCQTPIYSAIWRYRSRIRLQRALHSFPEFIHLRQEGTSYTYLHLVVAIGNEECEVSLVPMVYLLSNAGVDVDATDCRDRSALWLALAKQLGGLVVALLRVGTDQATVDYSAVIRRRHRRQDEEGRERLTGILRRYAPDIWTAATNNDLAAVFVLVNSWCRVKVRRRIEGRDVNLVEYLRLTGGSEEMVALLTSYEMTLEFVHSTLAGDEEAMLDILMDESDCDVDIMDISYVDDRIGILRPRSLRDTAISLGHPGRILQLLGPNCRKFNASTGIPDHFTLAVESSNRATAVDDKDVISCGSCDDDDDDDDQMSRFEADERQSVERIIRTESSAAEGSPLLSLSAIEPRIIGDDVTDDRANDVTDDRANDVTDDRANDVTGDRANDVIVFGRKTPTGSRDDGRATKETEDDGNKNSEEEEEEDFLKAKEEEKRSRRLKTKRFDEGKEDASSKSKGLLRLDDEILGSEGQQVTPRNVNARGRQHCTDHNSECHGGGIIKHRQSVGQTKKSQRKVGKSKIYSTLCLIS